MADEDGELTEPERRLWEKARSGDRVDLAAEEVDRTVRAEVLVKLLSARTAAGERYADAVQLVNAHITGTLDLGHAQIEVPLGFADCVFDEAPRLFWARLRSLHMMHCTMPGLVASGVTVDGHLWLEGSHVDGCIWLDSANVGGIVSIAGARLRNPGAESESLVADRLAVGANLHCDNGFTAEGEVRLQYGRVGGHLIFRGARLRNGAGPALDATGLAVVANVFLDGGFSAEGAVRLRRARLGGYLSLIGASLSDPQGTALNCTDMTVESDVYCSDGFSSDGSVDFSGATVAGELSLRAAVLKDATLDLYSLTAGQLDMVPASEPKEVDLSHARLRRLIDDQGSWPARMRLDGLTYSMLEPVLPATLRLAWLNRIDGNESQPYQQLAENYRRRGQERDARAVLVAWQRRRHSRGTLLGRVWGHLQEWTVGYGYRPMRAGLWILATVALGTVAFALHHPAPVGGAESNTAFNALVYSIDLVVPVIDLGQQSKFEPTGAEQWLATAMLAIGWVLTTTVATAISRVFSSRSV